MLFALMLMAAGAFVLIMGVRGSYWQAFGKNNPFSNNADDNQHDAPVTTK